jgi:2-methylcitrate dehydratase PrpD
MDDKPHAPTMVRRLAEWIGDFAAASMPSATTERARLILLDTLACALYASGDDKAASALAAVEKISGAPV